MKEWRLACPHSELNLVFPNSNGNYQSADNLAKRRFLPALNRAGIDKIRFHDLRHTVGTRLAEQLVPVNVIKELLGHSDVHTTMRYVHSTQGAKLQALNKLNSYN